ncbi:MAG TPA: RNA polymerase sigma factor [Rhizomicrobium sp.]|nr:RNA polymerase sigma factor [Rhizomicrobium sp.]
MVERPDTKSEAQNRCLPGVDPLETEADAWFIREILPLEASLMQYLHHNWRNPSEISDLRQEVYVRIYEAAKRELPERPKQFLFATARNLLINRVRHAQVVPIEAVSDLEALESASETPGPDRVVQARDELRLLQIALDKLPPRWRTAVMLQRIDGLSRKQIAERMGVTESTAAKYLADGICALAEKLYGAPTDLRREK